MLNHERCDLALFAASCTQWPPAMIHRSIQKILIFVSGSQCTSRPITRSTLTAPRRRSLLHSLQLESGKCVAAGLQSCRLAAGLQLRPSSSSVAKPHVGSSKCRTLEALAAGTWLAYNHASHTFNNDNENDNTQFHPTAQRYHERSNIVMKLSYLYLESWPVHSVLQSQAEYPR